MKGRWLERIFIAGMLLFCAVLSACVIARARLDFDLDDTARSLETSQGRERKQQYEYDEVVAQLPLTRAELAEVQPRAEAAAETVRLLKEERKRLRAEKQALTEALAAGTEAGTEATQIPAETIAREDDAADGLEETGGISSSGETDTDTQGMEAPE